MHLTYEFSTIAPMIRFLRNTALVCGWMLFLAPLDSLGEAAPSKGQTQSKEIFVDSVVASVDGQPITLKELCQRLDPPRQLSLQEAALDPEARFALDGLILEKLILSEAESKKISVSESEVEGYITEVANRNNLSREGFEQALAEENKTIDAYRELARLEILRSKLASRLIKDGVGISDEEVENYISEHPELAKSGAKVKISQIFVAREGRSSQESQELISVIREKLSDGEEFAELARKYSESGEGESGGSLGVIAEEDLNPQIFDAVYSLKKGEISEVIESSAGLHLFLLEERFLAKQEEEGRLQEEVRSILENQKLEAKMQTFFSSELFKLHSVDKKI